MNRWLKIAVAVAVFVVALLAIAMLMAETVLNSTAIKSQIVNSISGAIDMRFMIEGRIQLRGNHQIIIRNRGIINGRSFR